MNLSEQTCIPCEGGMPPLILEQAEIHVKQVPSWKLNQNSIEKDFIFKNFKEAIVFVNQIADIAEKQKHHPDITISYNKVHTSLTTHAIKGLSVNDFIIASKIDKLL